LTPDAINRNKVHGAMGERVHGRMGGMRERPSWDKLVSTTKFTINLFIRT